MDELQMRETLGLSGRGRAQARMPSAGAPKQRHRFVQDGEVQVVHLSGTREADPTTASRGRIAALEAALETEQAARAKAEQAAQSSIAQLHALETKLAHVEMAAREALLAERQAREHAEAELNQALAMRDAAREALAVREAMEATPVKKPRAKREPRQAPPRVKEQQPVKWWLGKTQVKAAAY